MVIAPEDWKNAVGFIAGSDIEENPEAIIVNGLRCVRRDAWLGLLIDELDHPQTAKEVIRELIKAGLMSPPMQTARRSNGVKESFRVHALYPRRAKPVYDELEHGPET